MTASSQLGSELGLQIPDDGGLAPEFEGVLGAVQAGEGEVLGGGEIDDFFAGEGFAVSEVVVERVAVGVGIGGQEGRRVEGGDVGGDKDEGRFGEAA